MVHAHGSAEVDKLQAARHAGVKSFLFGVEEAIQKIAAEHKSASGSVVSGAANMGLQAAHGQACA
eukprot:3372077-Amphidinium_carterae.1